MNVKKDKLELLIKLYRKHKQKKEKAGKGDK